MLRVTATLSDSSTHDVTTQSTISVAENGATSFHNSKYVDGVAAGTSTATGNFSNVSGSLVITVTADRVAISNIQYIDVFEKQTTLLGAEGDSVDLRVKVEFADSTQSNDVTALSWIDWADLVEFSSPLENIINVTGRSATLVENYWKTVDIKVQALCASGAITTRPSTIETVAANLEPELGDVDLGSRYGIQFPPRLKGETLSVDVSVNANSAPLITFQIVMKFDSTKVAATVERCRLTLSNPHGKRLKLIP